MILDHPQFIDRFLLLIKPRYRSAPVAVNHVENVHDRVSPIPLFQELTEEELETVELRIVSLIKNKYSDLWQGAPKALDKVSSRSEADFRLLALIGEELIISGVPQSQWALLLCLIFNRSSLAARDKWRNREDYRERTISKVIERLKLQLDRLGTGAHSNLTDAEALRDIKHANLFAQKYKHQLCFVHHLGRWYRWDQTTWVVNEHREEVEAAKRLAVELLAQARRDEEVKAAGWKQNLSDAKHAHTERGILSMLKLASSAPDLSVTIQELDASPMLLGARNGVIELGTGALLSADPTMFMTKCCRASYEADAPCPRWIRFLHEIFSGDEETIRAVQILLGKTLIGEVRDEIIVICYGNGANGKSVFSNVVHDVLGDYAHTAPPSLLNERRAGDNTPRSDVAALKGARYVSVNELQAGDRLDEQVVKALAGREPLAARFLYKEFFTFNPSFCVWVRTNHKPQITGEDPATWRRLVLIHFSRTFSKEQQNPLLERDLLEERDGILSWMVEGAQRYLRDGLYLSPRMLAELTEYRTESDILGEYLAERTEKRSDGAVDKQRLYSDYRYWCQDNGIRSCSKKTFTQRLKERGYGERHSGNDYFYTGLSLLPRPEQREVIAK